MSKRCRSCLVSWRVLVPLLLITCSWVHCDDTAHLASGSQVTQSLAERSASQFVHGSVEVIDRHPGVRPRKSQVSEGRDAFVDRESTPDASFKVKLKNSDRGERELEAAKAWKRKSREYKSQLVHRKRSPVSSSTAFPGQTDRNGRRHAGFGTKSLSEDSTKCDSTGCWTIDTSDEATKATLKAFREAARIKNKLPSMHAVTEAANAAVAAAAADVASMKTISKTMHQGGKSLAEAQDANPARLNQEKPLAHHLRPSCDNPWKHAQNSRQACAYVRKYCPQRSGLFNYLALPFCSLGKVSWLAILLLLLWLVALSIWLGLAADAFLCPCLTYISRFCNLSENVAGVTFLAFGNGAPDIFTEIAAAIASPHGAEMALGEVMGSSLIVAGVVFGIIAIVVPFQLPPREFVRDVLFFLLALFFLFVILLDSYISMLEAGGFMLLYIFYLYIVVFGTTYVHSFLGDEGAQRSKLMSLKTENEQSKGPRLIEAQGKARLFQSDTLIDLHDLVQYVNPIGKEEVSHHSLVNQVLYGIKVPAIVVMKLTCPVVDLELPNSGWCKSAVLVQLALCPPILVWCVLLHGFPTISAATCHIAFACSVVFGLLAAAIVHVSSKHEEPPPYLALFAFLGFFTSIAWIYALAAELVHLLQALGAVLDVSDTLMGLTVLSLANSVGDLVANLAMARAGMPSMAAAACIGAPLLNLLFGGGLATFLGNLLVASPYPFELNLQLYVSILFLTFSLIAMLVYAVMHKFEIRAPLGFILILIYGAFMITCLGFEAWGGRKLLTTNIGPQVRSGNFDFRASD
ncbi:hypothetical protein GUITHDRAFT_164587 [Guillardia theta CCMP2712]|uniref:Sodium/calcium exchanger membrane region domain-containing protein n=1 Tax=Guillardia theta (strain CCMP2712) TaxID=905079 RepID=L1IWP4_GUITC|nr:hypothetical protein GUITHDRAFT_164587 [Guillardia theta CCMP2712]EKX40666.1 hypothetical protein GUITHDRAFT_164587 [Guillardia theta CCMP2712]|eukprot:XP_005827646.1 hypothetical protein GUITHDRAFT_164587 [Guillardia theta CCMP2712]